MISGKLREELFYRGDQPLCGSDVSQLAESEALTGLVVSHSHLPHVSPPNVATNRVYQDRQAVEKTLSRSVEDSSTQSLMM